MRQILIICDEEEQYAFRMAEYLNNQGLLPFEVMAFDDMDKLELFLDSNPAAVLLIDTAMYGKRSKELRAGEVILLTTENTGAVPDNMAAEASDYMALPTITKYQSAAVIAKQILEICIAGTGTFLPKVKSMKTGKLIGIYSPIGRCLQTSFSLVLGQLLAQKKKCLYINLEPYSGFHSLFGKNYEHNMTDLFYFLQKGSERFIYRLKSTVEQIGKLDYIPPAESFLDLMDVDVEMWMQFVEAVTVQTDYEIIIFDLSDYIRGLFDILSACDHIYTIVKKDGMAMAKLDQYEQILSYTSHETILNKTKKCQIPIFKELPEQIEKLPYSDLAVYTKSLIQEDGL